MGPRRIGERLRRWCVPPPRFGFTAAEERAFRLVCFSSLTLITVGLPLIPFYAALFPVLGVVVAVASAIGVFNLFLLHRIGHLRIACHIPPALCYAVFLLGAVGTGGLSGAHAAWFFLLPVIGGILVGGGALVAYLVLTTATYLGLYLVQEFGGWRAPNLIPESYRGLDDLLSMLALLLVASFLTLIYLVEQRRSQRELIRARDEARAADRAKTAFLASVSHEIRTPMNGIIGASSLLLEEGLRGEPRELADIIHSSSHALQSLIDDILDFAKIESGRIEFEQIPFSPRRLTAEVHRLFRIEAERKGLRFEDRNRIPEDLRLLGDPSRLRQIVVNLVHNAIKFTAKGFVEVRARIEESESREYRRLVIEVADSGEGIGPRQRAEIFERFRQADVSVTRRHGGTGLGLSISRSLALLMGGDLRVESEPEEGSTFVLEVDLEEGGDSSSVRRAVRGMRKTFRGKVLLVEDNEVNRTVATAMLRNLGLEVDVAVDGREGVEKAVAGNYDLILMDLRMPVLDGLAAARRIGTERDPPPIVALTANVTEEDRRRCREAGMHDLVGKPIARGDLVECLEGILGDADADEATSRSGGGR